MIPVLLVWKAEDLDHDPDPDSEVGRARPQGHGLAMADLFHLFKHRIFLIRLVLEGTHSSTILLKSSVMSLEESSIDL